MNTCLICLTLSLILFQARLRMSDVVIDDDVNEAIRLVERSRDSTKRTRFHQMQMIGFHDYYVSVSN